MKTDEIMRELEEANAQYKDTIREYNEINNNPIAFSVSQYAKANENKDKAFDKVEELKKKALEQGKKELNETLKKVE